jgi:RimJ/RimL family protein N-acetyltransferase
MPLLDVRPAGPDDLPAVHRLLDEAAAWLVRRGIHQWPSPYPRASTERAVAGRTLWVGTRDGRPVAAMRLVRSDPEVWGDDPLPALYVHVLVVGREPLARGSGPEMLRSAARTAVREGCAVLRLDCWAGNGRLRRYYAEAGFRHVDDIEQSDGEGSWRCSRFEMAVD